MKVHKYIQKLSHRLDSKSICEKYGLYLADPIKRRKRQTNTSMTGKLQNKDGNQSRDKPTIITLETLS